MIGRRWTFQTAALLLVLLMTGIPSCRTRTAWLHRSKQSAEQLTESKDLKTRQQIAAELTYAEDSSQESYYVKIFPVDTFQFSAADGYRGRASQIVIRGKAERGSQLISKSMRMEEELSLKDSLAKSQAEHSAQDRFRKSEAKPLSFLSALLWIMIGMVLGVFVCFRLMRYRGGL